MRHFIAAIFDVDGTLLDTTEGVLSSVRYTIAKSGLPELSDELLKNFIGPPIQNSFKKYYSVNDQKAQELAEIFREQYKNVDLLKAVPYPGIYKVFEDLKKAGIKLAVATYKRQDYAIKLLQHFEFDKYTNILYGADPYNKLKKNDIIEKCMVDLEISDYTQAVMIGDSDNDAVGAQKLHMNFLGVTYGFGFKTPEDINAYPSIGYAQQPLDIIPFFENTGEK